MTKPNWLDRAVAFISPASGMRRAYARAALVTALGYDAGKAGRRNEGWVTGGGTSADADVMQYTETIRARARSLVQNNPHASKALAVLVANRIGTGILSSASEEILAGRRPNKLKNRKLNDRWKRFVDTADATGRTDYYGLLAQADRTRTEVGECLVRFLPSPPVAGGVPLQLLVLEPDFLDSARHERLSETRQIRYGVEYEGARPVAYYLFREHPGESAPTAGRRGFESERVPARDVLHYFKPLRAGQTRGISEFTNVMLRLRRLEDYDDAEVMRKNIAACLAAFVTTPSGLPAGNLTPTTTDERGRKTEKFTPGMIHYPPLGSTVTVADPKPSGDYAEFNSVQLHAIAAGIGVPYELLTTDLSEVTYTSHRGGLVQFKVAVEADQWQVVIPQLCRPIWERFAIEVGKLDNSVDPTIPATFTPPRFALLDPSKEIPPMIQAIQAGLYSYQNTIRGQGYDWEETLDQVEAFQKELTRRGIVITSDARVNASPQAQRFEPPEPAGGDDPKPPKPAPDEDEDEEDDVAA